jgi:hypothetical protein
MLLWQNPPVPFAHPASPLAEVAGELLYIGQASLAFAECSRVTTMRHASPPPLSPVHEAEDMETILFGDYFYHDSKEERWL